MKTTPPTLSRRERQIMDLIYQLGSATVAKVREQLDDAPSYSTIRTLMGVLEQKGHLSHRREGQSYVYAPTVPREKAAGAALARVVSTFFAGSVTDMVSTLIHDESNTATLDELAALIETARKENS